MECCNNSNNLIYLIILLALFSGDGCGCSGGWGNNGIWIILFLLFFGCNGQGSAINLGGCGCNTTRNTCC